MRVARPLVKRSPRRSVVPGAGSGGRRRSTAGRRRVDDVDVPTTDLVDGLVFDEFSRVSAGVCQSIDGGEKAAVEPGPEQVGEIGLDHPQGGVVEVRGGRPHGEEGLDATVGQVEGSEEFESGGFAGPPQAVEVGLVGVDRQVSMAEATAVGSAANSSRRPMKTVRRWSSSARSVYRRSASWARLRAAASLRSRNRARQVVSKRAGAVTRSGDMGRA